MTLGRARASGTCDIHKPHGLDTKHVHAPVEQTETTLQTGRCDQKGLISAEAKKLLYQNLVNDTQYYSIFSQV